MIFRKPFFYGTFGVSDYVAVIYCDYHASPSSAWAVQRTQLGKPKTLHGFNKYRRHRFSKVATFSSCEQSLLFLSLRFR